MVQGKLINIFARRLKGFRKQNNLLQRDLAEEAGLSLRHFQKIEAGQCELKLKTISRFANALNIPACYLLNAAECVPKCPTRLGCIVEILDLLPIGIQLIDTAGKILYVNQAHQDFLNKKINLNTTGTYIWEYFNDAAESKKIKTHFESIVQVERELATSYAKVRLENGDYFPVKIDWKFISNPDNKVKYLIATTTYHPSW